MAFLQGGEFLFVEKPARIKDFHKSQQPFSIPTWGRAKFPLALLLQLWPALQRANADSGQGLLGNLRAKPAWGWGGAGQGQRGRKCQKWGSVTSYLASVINSLCNPQFSSSHPYPYPLISLSKESVPKVNCLLLLPLSCQHLCQLLSSGSGLPPEPSNILGQSCRVHSNG